MEKLLITTAALFVCHFLADFTPLSTRAMLIAKAVGRPIGPIINHASRHATLMFFVLYFGQFDFQLCGCAYIIQLASHTLIDTGKGQLQGRDERFRNPANSWHWALFGFDQLLHALTILGIVLFLAKNGAFQTL